MGGGSDLPTGFYCGIKRSDGVFENMLTDERFTLCNLYGADTWVKPKFGTRDSTGVEILIDVDENPNTTLRSTYFNYEFENIDSNGSITVTLEGRLEDPPEEIWTTIYISFKIDATEFFNYANGMTENIEYIDVDFYVNGSLEGFEHIEDGHRTSDITITKSFALYKNETFDFIISTTIKFVFNLIDIDFYPTIKLDDSLSNISFTMSPNYVNNIKPNDTIESTSNTISYTATENSPESDYIKLYIEINPRH